MKIKDLRELTLPELAKQKQDLKEEMLNLRLQQKSGQLENPARLKIVRRLIARVETLATERRRKAAQAS